MLRVFAAALLLGCYGPRADAAVFTTTDFPIPTDFGLVLDGRFFEDTIYLDLKVLEVRLTWNVRVGQFGDAGLIDASVFLPLRIREPGSPQPIFSSYDLSGPSLGWSGSGTFSYAETFYYADAHFEGVGAGFGWSALYDGGVPFQTGLVEVLPGSKIEIDFVVNLPGDTDQDGDIDNADIGTLFANYTGTLNQPGPKNFAQGDTDNDGDIDDADIGTVFAGYTGTLAPAAVPEPATIFTALTATPLVLRRRRACGPPIHQPGS